MSLLSISRTLAVAVAVLSCLAIPSKAYVKGDVISPAFDEHFYEFIRPRLGHFSRAEGFMKIYEEYKSSILSVNDKELMKIGVNDWRNLRPTGEMCVDFLMGFQVKDYVLAKPYEVIMLDACLDWLFDTSKETQLDLDRFNVITKADRLKLLDDPEFKSIYNNTKFKGDKISKQLKEELHKYFTRLLKIHAENPRTGCNGLYLTAYDDFIEEVYLGDCEDDDKCDYFSKFENAKSIKKDSYLNLIVDTTKEASKNCYSIVQKQMVERMHQAYEDEPVQASIQRKFKKINSKAARQSTERKWGREMMRILQITSNKNVDDVVELADVVEVLRGIKENNEEMKENFTQAIGEYAIKEVDAKDTAGDAMGRARYGKAMSELCKPYIDGKSFLVRTGGSHLWGNDPTNKRKPFEFFDMVYSLVRITNHMSFYRISKENFERDVLNNGWEALYLATFACHVVSTTWGELSYDTNKPSFDVKLRRNFHESIDDWPLDIMYQQLSQLSEPASVSSPPRMAPKSPPRSPARSSEGSPARQSSGNKFMFGFLSGSSGSSSSSSEQESRAAEVEQAADYIQPLVSAEKPRIPPRSSKSSKTPIDKKTPKVQEKPKETISLQNIELFKKLHGRYPQLSDEVKEKYAADLPADLSGSYPIELPGPKKAEPIKKQEPRKEPWKSIDILSI